jgi:hypothetical protein
VLFGKGAFITSSMGAASSIILTISLQVGKNSSSPTDVVSFSVLLFLQLCSKQSMTFQGVLFILLFFLTFSFSKIHSNESVLVVCVKLKCLCLVLFQFGLNHGF